MELMIYLLIFITTLAMISVLYELIFYKNEKVKERLNAIKSTSDQNMEDELIGPFIQRIMKPGYLRLIKAVSNLTPKAIKDRYNNLIVTSGSSNNLTYDSLFMTQFMMGIVLAGFVYILLKYTSKNINMRMIFFVGVVGFLLPILYLYSKVEKRKEKIRRSLPDLLDLLYVSVEAGLGFDSAVKKSVEKMKGPFSIEIMKSMNDISKGRDREESLKGLYDRTGVDDVSTFVTAVIQTEKLGANITNMLKVQSVTMRQKRRQRAEEKAAKIPIKMLFPLIFFMLPSLFVVILGPAIIHLLDSFSSM